MLDTNVFVSGPINPEGPPADILRALRSNRFTLISSPPINEEIIEVLNRPYLRERYGPATRIFDVSFILWEVAALVFHLPDLRARSDPDDDKFLAAAVGSRANYLVTGNVGDLLPLHGYQNVTILSPREFASILKR